MLLHKPFMDFLRVESFDAYITNQRNNRSNNFFAFGANDKNATLEASLYTENDFFIFFTDPTSATKNNYADIEIIMETDELEKLGVDYDDISHNFRAFGKKRINGEIKYLRTFL
jgi:hypothetical protein